MIEQFLLQYTDIISNPFIYGITLLVMIVTQVFGVFFNVVLLVVVRFMDGSYFWLITVASGLLGETICYFLGLKLSPFFIKRFKKTTLVLNKYTSFLNFILGKFVGVPVLGYLMGATGSISYKKFFTGNFVFFAVNASIVLILGKTLPSKYYNIAVVLFLCLIIFQGAREIFQKRK